MKNALILLAGGSGKRFISSKNRTPKQFIKFEKCNLIEYFLHNLEQEIFDIIIIVANKKYQKKYLFDLKKNFFNHNI